MVVNSQPPKTMPAISREKLAGPKGPFGFPWLINPNSWDTYKSGLQGNPRKKVIDWYTLENSHGIQRGLVQMICLAKIGGFFRLHLKFPGCKQWATLFTLLCKESCHSESISVCFMAKQPPHLPNMIFPSIFPITIAIAINTISTSNKNKVNSLILMHNIRRSSTP